MGSCLTRTLHPTPTTPPATTTWSSSSATASRSAPPTSRGASSAAAVKLGVVVTPELEDEEIADLVTLAAQGVIDEPVSRLGRYLVRNWERVSLVGGESLVYWLRKLIFRGAWLDHQVKRGALEVVWDEDEAEFAYQHPGGGGRPLLELAPVPSWHELQFRP